MRRYNGSLHKCRKCKSRWILWMTQENFKKWKRITVGDCLTFSVNQQVSQVLVPCRAATNACLLTHGIHLDYRKTFLVFIFLRQHRTDRKLMGLLKEQCQESSKGHLRCCYYQVWTKNGGRIPWNATAKLRNIPDLLSGGKTPYEWRFGVPFGGPVIPFGAMVQHQTPGDTGSVPVHNGTRTLVKRDEDLNRAQYQRRHLQEGRRP